MNKDRTKLAKYLRKEFSKKLQIKDLVPWEKSDPAIKKEWAWIAESALDFLSLEKEGTPGP